MVFVLFLTKCGIVYITMIDQENDIQNSKKKEIKKDSEWAHIKTASLMAIGMVGIGGGAVAVDAMINESQPKSNPIIAEQDRADQYDELVRSTATSGEFKKSDQVGVPFIAEQDTSLLDLAQDTLNVAFGDKAKKTFTDNFDTMKVSAESLSPQPGEEYAIVDPNHDGKKLIITRSENIKEDVVAVDTIPSPTFEGAPSIEAQDKN